jgi:predicted nucleic acid-binding protein
MSRPRIVLDTSVLVSAALKPLGQPAQVIYMIAWRGQNSLTWTAKKFPACWP